MNNGFDVYDEWGNYKGRFTPAWSTESCIGSVIGIVLLAIGFLFYIIIKLFIDGFRAAISGHWGRALIYLSISFTVSGLFVLLILFGYMRASAITSESLRDIQDLSYISPSSTPRDPKAPLSSTLPAIPSAVPERENFDFFDPQGTPLSEWNGVPIMPQATTGEELNEYTYSFKVTGTVQEAVEYYKTELDNLNWSSTFNLPVEGEGGIMLYSKDDSLLTLTFTSLNGEVVIVLTLG